ncbi:MAG: HNH endonuclease family protein, partial [Deltaproteobacteria bacterium]|nr:HNH endonuclease family protein [Deltaproteobacteria bacterium]
LKKQIYEDLKTDHAIQDILNFSECLQDSFTDMREFFIDDEKKSLGNNVWSVHSLISLGPPNFILPFIIKIKKFSLSDDDLYNFCSEAEIIQLRHLIIGSGANLSKRFSEVFKLFTDDNCSVEPFFERINYLKSVAPWWDGYWNNDKLNNNIRHKIGEDVIKYILWKYENHLIDASKTGTNRVKFKDFIFYKQIEHIAPQTENMEENSCYDKYDQDFVDNYLYCLGNCLIIPRQHNIQISNGIFSRKFVTYVTTFQEREIRKFLEVPDKWGKKEIDKRFENIKNFLLNILS